MAQAAWTAANALDIIRAGSRWECSDETFYWKMLIHRHQNVSWKCSSFSELTRKPRHDLDAAVAGLLPGYPMLAECVLAGQLCPLGCSSPSSAKASGGLALAELLAALNPQHEMGWGFVLLSSFQVQQALLLLLGKEGKSSGLFTEIELEFSFSINDNNPGTG